MSLSPSFWSTVEPGWYAAHTLTLWVPGRVPTKKNGRRWGWCVRDGKRVRVSLPPAAWLPWARGLGDIAKREVLGPPPWRMDPSAMLVDRKGRHSPQPWRIVPTLYVGPVHVCAVYTPHDYRWMPDLSGMEESVGDALEVAGIVDNDRQVRSWDGSKITDPDPERWGLVLTVGTVTAEQAARNAKHYADGLAELRRREDES